MAKVVCFETDHFGASQHTPLCFVVCWTFPSLQMDKVRNLTKARSPRLVLVLLSQPSVQQAVTDRCPAPLCSLHLPSNLPICH